MLTLQAETSYGDWRLVFRRRRRWLIGLLGLWLVVVVWRLVDVAVVERAFYLDRLAALSWRVGTLPALRGRILDDQGRPLAWSVRQFRLVYQVPPDGLGIGPDLAALAAGLPADVDTLYRLAANLPGRPLLVHPNLSPLEVLALQELVRTNPRWQVQNSWRRERADGVAPVLPALGDTRVYGQKEVGLTGWEQQYDEQLRGQDGVYRVMVDREGRWLPDTWQQLRPPQAGYDVYVALDVNR